jgi:succinylarginine dihydrolase
VFVFGRDTDMVQAGFPARQTRSACEAIARRHGLVQERTVHLRQSRAAIDAGAFHNDVVAVAHRHVLFHHEQAFEDGVAALEAVRRASDGCVQPSIVTVAASDVPLGDAIQSYLFNSQLLDDPTTGEVFLYCPREVEETPSTRAWVAANTGGNSAIARVEYADVRQSMRNGGGPACLRLRVVLTDAERRAMRPGFFLDAPLYAALKAWVTTHYRDRLTAADLADPALIEEVRTALDALTGILPLGSDFYSFQRA